MPYDTPGRADKLSGELTDAWNDTIREHYDDLALYQTRFFSPDPASLGSSDTSVIHWFADPAEPAFCFDEEVARKLADWMQAGRNHIQNEYCEYAVIYGVDSRGRRRPKRVTCTTELREYWVMLAENDPQVLRATAASILGNEPSWQELYGVADPLALSPAERAIRFSIENAGHGKVKKFEEAGVPAFPTGTLNTRNALFMTNLINGLDDLLYIVMFGAKPYAQRVGADLRPATKEQIFRNFGVQHLACRHADPTAAMGAHENVFQGKGVAFANPLGMYIFSFTSDVFMYEGGAVPEAWVRFGRGAGAGLYQRLEFGPGDEDDAFLDDIKVIIGEDEFQVTGGYQIVKQMEVGPRVAVARTGAVGPDEYEIIAANPAPIRCREADVCGTIRQLKEQYEQEQLPVGLRRGRLT